MLDSVASSSCRAFGFVVLSLEPNICYCFGSSGLLCIFLGCLCSFGGGWFGVRAGLGFGELGSGGAIAFLFSWNVKNYLRKVGSSMYIPALSVV